MIASSTPGTGSALLATTRRRLGGDRGVQPIQHSWKWMTVRPSGVGSSARHVGLDAIVVIGSSRDSRASSGGTVPR